MAMVFTGLSVIVPALLVYAPAMGHHQGRENRKRYIVFIRLHFILILWKCIFYRIVITKFSIWLVFAYWLQG